MKLLLFLVATGSKTIYGYIFQQNWARDTLFTYNCMEDVIPGAGPYTQLLPGLVVRAGQPTGRYTQ